MNIALQGTGPVSSGETSPLIAMTPGLARILSSSASRGWHGVLLERHLTSPGERTAGSIDKHVISMVTGAAAHFERRREEGTFVAGLARPGTLILTPAGPVPEMKLATQTEFVHCALDIDFIRAVMSGLGGEPLPAPVFRAGFQDKSIQRLLGLLTEELESERPLGGLYVESLAHALATRYLLLDDRPSARPRPPVAALPPRILKRVREKIEANLDTELSLDSLAEESGYSRAHFHRMFRAATGATPHQFVLDLRLSRAQAHLKQKDSSIIEVALSCGFSSQSHMTNVFRQRLEVTPAEFRRNA